MAGKKKTGRTKQLSLKSKPRFHQRLKELAVKEKCLMIEVLEEALKLYEQARKEKRLRKGAIKGNIIVKSLPPPSTSKKRSREDDAEEANTSSKKRKFDD